MTMFRRSVSLYLVLAFAWSEQVVSFSSLSIPTTTILPGETSTRRLEPKFSEIQRRRLQHIHMRMAVDDSSSSEIDSAESSKKSSQDQSANGEKLGDNSQTNNVILVVPLVMKFMVVLMIKFLTDLVVFPSLFLYRLGRRGKRKIIGLFDRSSSTIKPNGSTE